MSLKKALIRLAGFTVIGGVLYLTAVGVASTTGMSLFVSATVVGVIAVGAFYVIRAAARVLLKAVVTGFVRGVGESFSNRTKSKVTANAV